MRNKTIAIEYTLTRRRTPPVEKGSYLFTKTFRYKKSWLQRKKPKNVTLLS